MGDGVYQRLAESVLRHFVPFVSAADMRSQLSIQLGLGVGVAILVARVEVAREVLQVEDVRLGRAPRERAGAPRLQAVAANFVGQQARDGVRHLPSLTRCRSSSAVSGSIPSGMRARAANLEHAAGVRSCSRSKLGHGVSSKRLSPSW